MNSWILATGALLGATAVAAGAFGAHALQGMLSAQARGWFDTAVSYHTTHAVAVVVSGLAVWQAGHGSSTGFTVSALCFIAGIVLFSGSLYTMAFTGITRLGMITPIGGALLIAGWLSLALAATKITS